MNSQAMAFEIARIVTSGEPSGLVGSEYLEAGYSTAFFNDEPRRIFITNLAQAVEYLTRGTKTVRAAAMHLYGDREIGHFSFVVRTIDPLVVLPIETTIVEFARGDAYWRLDLPSQPPRSIQVVFSHGFPQEG